LKRWSIKICGEAWVYNLMTEEKFLIKHRDVEGIENKPAITDPDKKTMDFKEVCIGIVRHEVRHAYTAEKGLDAADLSGDQMEEIQCQLDEEKYDKMKRTVEIMFKNLSRIPVPPRPQQ